jgi:hypothetical protein
MIASKSPSAQQSCHFLRVGSALLLVAAAFGCGDGESPVKDAATEGGGGTALGVDGGAADRVTADGQTPAGDAGPGAAEVGSGSAAGFTTVLTNFDIRGAATVRFDVDGHSMDAHDGELQLFGDTYYLYGTSYDCGYGWFVAGSPFCGFKVYSSPDLVHFTDRGFLFDARTPDWQGRCNGNTYGCYRPHVVYNEKTKQYVLWINSYDVGIGYHVFQSPTPVGPFVEVPIPTLAVNNDVPPGVNNGDHDVYVDEDGTAYLIFTDWRSRGDIVVERLNDSYLTGTGMFTRLGIRNTEAPAMFRRDGRYYITLSYPNCGYCTTGTGYMTAPSPLGPWTGEEGIPTPSKISLDSCGGQPAALTVLPGKSGPIYLFQSDLWNNAAANESLANYYWAPLEFGDGGIIKPFGCLLTAKLDLAVGRAGANKDREMQDQSSGRAAFRQHCDIGALRRLQSFTAGRSGRLTSVGFTAFRQGLPDGELLLEVVRLLPDGLPGEVLASKGVAPTLIGWSSREQVFALEGVTVTAGEKYGIVVRAAITAGNGTCYGFAYNDDNAYPRGEQRYSNNGGTTWTLEPNRALKFTTTVVP